VILYTTLRDNFLGTKILEISPYLWPRVDKIWLDFAEGKL
jgi:hypothetical protein